MAYLAKASERGTLQRLDLSEVELIIVDCWLEEWPSVDEDEDMDSRRQSKRLANEAARLRERQEYRENRVRLPEEEPLEPLDSQSTCSSPLHPLA